MATPDIAQQLIQRVKASPFTMAAVCAEAGVATSTPSRWAHSKVPPNQKTVQKLDAALDALLSQLRRKAA